MTAKILVCWEDRFHEKLDLCLRRALRHRFKGATPPILFFDDARGNGGFVPYIRKDWSKIAQRGLVKSGGPIDHLVCVADADRAHECCAVPNHVTVTETTEEWVKRADEAWTTSLRSAAGLEPHRILGRFLRWNQESLLIAAHDVDEALKRLGCRDIGAVRAHLKGCDPSPLDTPDEAFVDRHRKPGRCLDDMLKAGGGNTAKKGGQAREDALDEASRLAIDRLCARVPDLAALVDCLSGLAAVS